MQGNAAESLPPPQAAAQDEMNQLLPPYSKPGNNLEYPYLGYFNKGPGVVLFY